MPTPRPGADDPNLIYVNGIDFNTGDYAFTPRSIDDIAASVSGRPGLEKFGKTRGDERWSFALPFGMRKTGRYRLGHRLPRRHVRADQGRARSLDRASPQRAGARLKVLDYKKGEQLRDWYTRHGISPAGPSFSKVPYYLLLIGPPDLIPFEFQYLLGVEYAVGRLAFDNADDYERYVRSTIAYESAGSVPNAKKIALLGHPPSRRRGHQSQRVVPDRSRWPTAFPGRRPGPPINKLVGYDQKLFLGEDATKANLLATLHAAEAARHAVHCLARHGVAIRARAEQAASQGALLCQDWPGFGSVKAEHFLAAADIADDANVNGMVALLFACFGAGTPDADQFLMDLSQAGTAPPLAPKPFIAALPRRLLAHPERQRARGDRPYRSRLGLFDAGRQGVATPQIATFRNSIGFYPDRDAGRACGVRTIRRRGSPHCPHCC